MGEAVHRAQSTGAFCSHVVVVGAAEGAGHHQRGCGSTKSEQPQSCASSQHNGQGKRRAWYKSRNFTGLNKP